MTKAKTTLRTKTLDAAKPGEKAFWLWDDRVVGLGCRIYPSGRKSFFAAYRTLSGTPQRIKLGDYGQLTLETARDAMRDVLACVRQGRNPAQERRTGRAAPLLRDLAERYMREHANVFKKRSSTRMDRINLDRHVLPKLGGRKIREVTHAEIVQLHQSVGRSAPGAANRVLSLVSKMFNLAEKWGLRDAGTNPAKHVRRFRERRIERYLTPHEYARLASAIGCASEEGEIEREAGWAFRLLMLTGCRLGEILRLQRSHVDQARRELILVDAKAGGRRVYLSDQAFEVVREVFDANEPKPGGWLLERPGRLGQPLSADWMWHRWRKVRKWAQLHDLRIHDLRHALASVAAEQGYSLPMIAALLGHKSPATAARYAHLVAAPVHEAARTIGDTIVQKIDDGARVIELSKAGS